MFCRLLLRAETMAGLCREMGREEQRGLSGLGTRGDTRTHTHTHRHTHTHKHTCVPILCSSCRSRLVPMMFSRTTAFGSGVPSPLPSVPSFLRPGAAAAVPSLDLFLRFSREFSLCKCQGAPGGEGCGRRGGAGDGAAPTALPRGAPAASRSPSLPGSCPSLPRYTSPARFPIPAQQPALRSVCPFSSVPSPCPAPARSPVVARSHPGSCPVPSPCPVS